MLPRATSTLLGLSLLVAAGCDQPSEEELRGMMSEVADDKVGELAKRVDALQDDKAELTKANEALKSQVTALEDEVTKLTSLATELDTQLRDSVKRVDDLEAKALPTVKPGRPDPTTTYKVTLGDAPTRGPDDALVTVVIFSDFQCPYCKRVVATLEELERDYGSDLRLAFKHNPLGFHTNALPAAKAAMAAQRQGKFWEMHDKLFDNNHDLSEANFIKWAKELKLDVPRFKKDLADSGIERAIKDDQSQATTLGARGTPAFFINGRFLSGAQPRESFAKVIDEEIAKARALVATGTARDRVYEQTVADGATAAP